MLSTTDDIKTEFLVRDYQNTASGFLNDTILNDWLKQGYRWACSYKKWPFTEGRVSTTYASLITDEDGELRGEYPEGWKPDSIRWMWIGGKRLRKLNFQQYKRFREETPNSQEHVFTDYGRLYYVNPNADVSGTVTVWGQFTPAELDTSATENTITTIFSNIDDDANEAIVEKMLEYSKTRQQRFSEANIHMQKSVALLEGIWQRVKDEQFGYHPMDAGQWEHFSVLQGGFRDGVNNPNRWS